MAETFFLEKPVVIIENVFVLSLQKNSGIAFSLPVPIVIQIIATFFFLIFGGWWIYEKGLWKKNGIPWCLGLVLGGAMGNLVERISDGAVTDFIDFFFFPSFNIADTAIFIGIMGFLFLGKDTERE